MVTREYNLPYRVVHVYLDGRITVESYHRTIRGAKTAVLQYRAQTSRKNRYEVQAREIEEFSGRGGKNLRAHSIEQWVNV